MKRYAIINTTKNGSCGKIALGLQEYISSIGNKCFLCFGHGQKNGNDQYKIDNFVDHFMHLLYWKLTGRGGNSSVLATRRLVSFLRSQKVEALFIINLHGYYIDEKTLFDYCLKYKIKVLYIMADESAYLGNCSYRNGCDNYLKGCADCPKLTRLQKLIYPKASSDAFSQKRFYYSNLSIAFAAPQFVIESAKQSPLTNSCKMNIVDEAIDVNVNHPRDTGKLREELFIGEDKIVLVCVAPYNERAERKGVKYYIEAARRLERDNRFVFVQVGYGFDDKSSLPSNYIPIGYISNQDLLTYYYSMADLFIFPSLEDTMSNACLEAMACGSPLLCFNISGMPYLGDETVMTLIEPKNVDQIVNVIQHTSKKTAEQIKTCREYALKRYDSQKYFEKLKNIIDII